MLFSPEMFWGNLLVTKEIPNQWNIRQSFFVYLVITFTTSDQDRLLNLIDQEQLLLFMNDAQNVTKKLTYENIKTII